MTAANWIALTVVCATGAISPGPSLAVVMRSTMAGGARAGLATSWAHAVGIGLHALLGVLGLAVVIASSPTLFRGITYAGAVFLLYLAIQAFRHAGDGFDVAETNASGAKRGARDGLIISLLNPKIAVWFLALFGQFVRPGSTTWEKIAMALLAFGIDGLWYTVVTIAVSRGPILEWLRRNGKYVQWTFGVVLIVIAARVALT